MGMRTSVSTSGIRTTHNCRTTAVTSLMLWRCFNTIIINGVMMLVIMMVMRMGIVREVILNLIVFQIGLLKVLWLR